MVTVLDVPRCCLILLVGIVGSGKSNFARQKFDRYEVVSSDECRGVVANDEGDQDATPDAFELVRFVVTKRLARGLLTVVDATNLQQHARQSLSDLARGAGVPVVAIVLDVPLELCRARNRARTGRTVAESVLVEQSLLLRDALTQLPHESLDAIYVLESASAVESVSIRRVDDGAQTPA